MKSLLKFPKFYMQFSIYNENTGSSPTYNDLSYVKTECLEIKPFLESAYEIWHAHVP